jgi:hypothetical protein
MLQLQICLSILALLPAPADQGSTSIQPAVTSVAKAVAVPALERVVVVGASVSDGFGLDLDVNARTTLADVIDAALKTKHDPVKSSASSFLFADVFKSGRDEIETAKAKNPTLIVGVDYLFWFGYGRVSEEAARFERFEKGLALLEDIPCPLLVGNLPDMSQALNGESVMTGRPMLHKGQLPAPETLKKLNERLAEWAAKHKNVVIVPIASLLARMQAGDEITLRGNVLPKDSTKDLFQSDLLHPTLHGAAAVSLLALDSFLRTQPTLPADAIEWDIKTISKKVYDAKEPERKAKLEKQKKDKERAEARRQPAPTSGDSSGKEPAPH